MIRDAVLSEDGRYRYLLTRDWSDEAGVPNGVTCTFVMLNPSKADATVDDPTITRCVGFAKASGHTGLRVVNLFALRATDPNELIRAGKVDAVGPDNDRHLREAARLATTAGGVVIAAWGAHDLAWDRAGAVFDIFGADMWCLGTTKQGAPRHPVRLPRLTPLQRWKP